MSETKLVQVNLAALTRVEWSALVRVPRGVDLQEVTPLFERRRNLENAFEEVEA